MVAWQTLTTRAEKGSNLTSGEADNIVVAVRQLQDTFDAGLTGFVPAGTWAAATAYTVNDLITIAGETYTSYVCTEDHTSTSVFDDDATAGYWQGVAERGDQATAVTWEGAWSSVTAYTQGDGVRHNGRLYVALQNTTNNEPPNTTYWEPFREYQALIGVDCSAGATLSDAQYQDHSIFSLTGTLTGNQDLNVPAEARKFCAVGAFTGAFAVTVQVTGGAGAGVDIEPGDVVDILCDGVDCVVMTKADHESRIAALETAIGGGTILSGSAVWNPPSLNNGAGTSTTVTVTGAAMGMPAHAGFSLSLSGLSIWAEVTAADTVTVYLYNDTGGTVNLASGTVKAIAFNV